MKPMNQGMAILLMLIAMGLLFGAAGCCFWWGDHDRGGGGEHRGYEGGEHHGDEGGDRHR